MFFIYSLIYFCLLILILPYEYIKRDTSIRKRWFREKLGHIQLRKDRQYIWIHAVSVGEVNAGVPLINAIKRNFPDYEIVLSTITDTGQIVATKHFKDIKIVYLPFDIPFCIKKAMSQVSLLIILETELWPNLLRSIGRQSVPILLVNGRISDKSFNGYKRIKCFVKKIIKYFTYICVQNNVYADRIQRLGAMKEKIVIMGNLKFDLSLPTDLPDWTNRLENRIVLAGSTHNPEEELIINSFLEVLKVHPNTTLIIAPRHPERFNEVENLLRQKGLNYSKRSELEGSKSRIKSNFILLDVMGELAKTYGVCDIAIMGGSFIKHGGQNPLEPAFWSKAIVCGPHMENFAFIEYFYMTGAAIRCEQGNLSEIIINLLSDEQNRLDMGRKAKYILDSNSGAVDKVIDLLRHTLKY